MRRAFSYQDQFLNCERRFFKERIQKLPQPASMFQSLGKLYHSALAEVAAGRPPVYADLVAKHTCYSDWVCPTPQPALVKELAHNMERVQREILPHLQPLEIEGWKETPEFAGRLDYISACRPIVDDACAIIGSQPNVPTVIDWKVKFSVRNRRTQEDAENASQLAQYALLAGTTAAGYVEIPRDGDQPIHTIMVDFTPQELERWRRYLTAQYEAMESRGVEERAYRLAARGHYLCCERFCPWWNGCPGGK